MIAETAAYSAGRIAGQALVPLLLMLGVAKCWSISRRPTTNRKCVLALMLVLIAWAAGGIVGVLPRQDPALRVISGLVGLAIFGLFVAAIVLAIIGLVEYSRARTRYRQGKAQAIWALVLCGICLFFAAAGFLSGLARGGAMSRPLAVGTPLVFEEYNFTFTAPGRPWGQADAAKLNPYAKLALVRADPEAYFMVSAEQSVGADLSSEGLAEFSLTRMRSLADSLQVLSRRPLEIAGVLGLRVETEALLRGFRVFYVHWFCVTNGWSYQLMTWGRADHRQAIAGEAAQLMERFALMDYVKHPPPGGRAQLSDFVSTNLHYVVYCGTPEWLPWNKLDAECQYASFGALNRNDAALAVSAVWLMGLNPRPEAIYRALLEVAGLGGNNAALSGARAIHERQLDGIETQITMPSTSGREFDYRVKILQGGGFAYLVAAWKETGRTGTDKLLADAVSRVDFPEAPPTGPDLTLLDGRDRRAHRLALNAIGMVSYREGQFAQAARCFKSAVDLDDFQNATPYLANFTEASIGAGQFREALDELDRHSTYVEAQPALQAQRAFLQGRLGQRALALTNYARLFATGYNAEEHFREYISQLAETEETEKVLAEIESFLKKQDAPGVRLVQATLLKRGRRFADAIALLQGMREKDQFNAGIAYSLGDTFIQAGQPNEALALSAEMMKRQGASAGSWLLKGRAEFALKWYREAKESLERSLKESPANPETKYLLEAVSGMLGEGSNTSVKEPIPPVSVPAELLELPVPSAGFGQEEGAYYLRRLTAVCFEKGKESRTTDYLAVKTLTAAGVSAFSTFQLGFNPLNEEIYVNQIDVRDAAGSLVSTGRVADSYVLDDRTSSAAGSHKVLNVPVSGLQPGCTISLAYTRREFGPAREFSFLAFSFSRGMPILESVLYVSGETGAVRYASAPRLEPESIGSGLCWRQKDPPLVRWEPLLPSVTDYTPMVWVSDASANWTEIVTNYLDTIRDRLVLPPEQQKLSRQLTGNATNLSQKLAAIAGYVQTNYTYKAIEFGRRARTPQPVADILRNKYGDCKDHAVLAQQMLAAAGVPASLALVSLNSPNRKDLPSLDQFDHMLVHIPTPSGDSFLDCTVKGADLGAPWSLGLAGREALVLDATNPRFVRIGDYPTNASSIRTTRSVDLTNQTDVLVHEKVVFNGVHAGFMRDYLRNLPPESRRSYVSSQIIGSAGQLTDLAFDGLEQPLLPLEIRATYVALGQFQTVERQIVGRPPIGFERAFLVNEIVGKRVTPFEISVPLAVDGTTTINIPPEFRPRPQRELSTNAGNTFVTCRANTEIIENGWRVKYQLYEPAGRHPAAEYGDRCRAMQQMVELMNPRLVGEQIQK